MKIKLRLFGSRVIGLVLIVQLAIFPVFAGLDEIILMNGQYTLVSPQYPMQIIHNRQRLDESDLNPILNQDMKYYTTLPIEDFNPNDHWEFLYAHRKPLGRPVSIDMPISRSVYNKGDSGILMTPLDDLALEISFRYNVLKLSFGLNVEIPYFSVLINGDTHYYANQDLRDSNNVHVQAFLNSAQAKKPFTYFTSLNLRGLGVDLGVGLSSHHIKHLSIFSPFFRNDRRKIGSTFHINKEMLEAAIEEEFANRTMQHDGAGIDGERTIQDDLKQATNAFLLHDDNGISDENSDTSSDSSSDDSSDRGSDRQHSNQNSIIIEEVDDRSERGSIELEYIIPEEPLGNQQISLRNFTIDLPKFQNLIMQYSKTRNFKFLEEAERLAKNDNHYLALTKIYQLKSAHYSKLENDKEKALAEIRKGELLFGFLKEGDVAAEMIQYSLHRAKTYLTKGEESELSLDAAISFAKNLKSPELEVKALLSKAYSMENKNDGEILANKALVIAASDANSCAEIYRYLHVNAGTDWEPSVEHANHALFYAKESNDDRLIGRILFDIGNTFVTRAWRDSSLTEKEKTVYNKKALKYYKKALRRFEGMGDLTGQSQDLYYMGNVSGKIDDYEEALRFLPERNLKLKRKILTAAINASNRDYIKAEKYAEELFQITPKSHNILSALAFVHSKYGQKAGREGCRERDIRHTRIAIEHNLEALSLAGNDNVLIDESLKNLKHTMGNLILTISLSLDKPKNFQEMAGYLDQLNFVIANTENADTLCSAYMEASSIHCKMAEKCFDKNLVQEQVLNLTKALEDVRNAQRCDAQEYIGRLSPKEKTKKELIF